nr:hypothetical protein [uncultured Lichenicoccus sp.]
MKKIRIGPGELYVTRRPDETIITVLGSCVAACIRDPVAGIGGMNHFMLPASATGEWGEVSASMRYGNFAMERLINDILCGGGVRGRLEVKLFGGGSMLTEGAPIGHRNADFVEAYLQSENMGIAAQHLRGLHARRIEYAPLTGKVMMLEIEAADRSVTNRERGFSRTILQPAIGSVELFE